MTTNNPLTSAIATTNNVTSGILPTGTSGVTLLPLPAIWDANYANADGTTGAWRPVVGKDGVGMSIVISSDSVGLAKDATLTGGTTKVQVTTLPNVTLGAALPAGTNMIGHVDVDTLPAVTLGTDSVGLAKDATLTGGNAKVQVTTLPALPAGTNQIGHVVVDTQPLPSSPLAASGKATCAATDNNVAPTGGFKHISIKNLDSTNEIIVTIDESSVTSPTKPIYLEAGESFDDYISGSALHYSASTGSPVLKYVLR